MAETPWPFPKLLWKKTEWLKWRVRPRSRRVFVDREDPHHLACWQHRTLLKNPTLAYCTWDGLVGFGCEAVLGCKVGRA